MKRIGLMAVVLLALGLGGCEPQDSVAQYDPQVDGLLPHQDAAPDVTIMENQKQLYDKMVAANGGGVKPVTSAPAASAPATAPEGGVVPAPEAGGEGAAPAATAPAGEGVTPLPPKQ